MRPLYDLIVLQNREFFSTTGGFKVSLTMPQCPEFSIVGFITRHNNLFLEFGNAYSRSLQEVDFRFRIAKFCHATRLQAACILIPSQIVRDQIDLTGRALLPGGMSAK